MTIYRARPRYTYEDVEDMLPEDMPPVVTEWTRKKQAPQPTGIKRAQDARADKMLDKRVSWRGRSMTRRQMIEEMLLTGKPKVYREQQHDAEDKLREKLRRMDVPFGNPNHPDTIAYNDLKAKLKDGIYKERVGIQMPDGTWYELNKTEMAYFERLAKSV